MPDSHPTRPSERLTKPFTVRIPTKVKQRLQELQAARGRAWYSGPVNTFILLLLKSVDGKLPDGVEDTTVKPQSPPS